MKILILEENDSFSPLSFPYDNAPTDKANGSHLSNSELSGGLIIDKAAYTVYINGSKTAFPKKEFELLLLLASNPRKVFKRTEILLHIWGKDFKQKDSRSLDVHIRMLRKKLSDDYITTIRGVGYKLEK